MQSWSGNRGRWAGLRYIIKKVFEKMRIRPIFAKLSILTLPIIVFSETDYLF